MFDDVSESELELLRQVLKRGSEEFRVVRRAQIVLHVLETGSIRGTATEFSCERKTVRRWLTRWLEKRSVDALRDAPRSGRPPKVGVSETAKTLSIVSQEPSAYDLVTAGWTQQQVVDVLGTMDVELSRSSVQRILARQDIDVRSVRYWLFTPTDRENFIERRDAICALYERMDALPSDEIVVCFDPKPGIQILSDPKNRGGSLGVRPGQPRRVEFEYRRLGTRTLVAAVSPLTGEVLHYDLYHKDRRFHSAATIEFLEELRIKLKKRGYRVIHLVLDNGSTHVSKATSAYLAEHSASFKTYFTPVHASWLNLCENFFSTFTRRYLKNRRYRSIEEFLELVPRWVADHNERCNGLRWTYAPHQKAA